MVNKDKLFEQMTKKVESAYDISKQSDDLYLFALVVNSNSKGGDGQCFNHMSAEAFSIGLANAMKQNVSLAQSVLLATARYTCTLEEDLGHREEKNS